MVLHHTLIILVVIVGILCLGNLIKIADYLVKGMSPFVVVKLMAFIIMSILDYAVPMSLLVGTLLVFGRLSADNEITAMRASGIGLKTIVTPVILLGLAFTLGSTILNNEIIPRNTFNIRLLKQQVGIQGPEVLLEPGEFMEFPGYAINIRNREGDYFRNISIYQYENEMLKNVILAKKAKLVTDPEKKLCYLHLEDGSLDEYDPDNPQISTRTTFGVLDYPIDVSDLFGDAKNVKKRVKDMTGREVVAHRKKLLRSGGDPADVSRITTELHRRFSLSVACLAFVVIGIPLAITTHRGEKSIGMAISLAVLFIYYIFILFANAIEDEPRFFPYLIVWIPNLLFMGLGIFLTVKHTRI